MRQLLELMRAGVARLGGVVAMVIVPESGEEATVLIGLVGLAAMFVMRGQPDLAVGVPAGLLVAIGLGLDLRRGR